jgi:hypothetical protein
MITLTLRTLQDTDDPWAFIAVIEPEQEIGGYPVLRVIDFGAGKERVEDFRRRLEDPPADHDYGRADGPTEVIVEDVKLAYYAPLALFMPAIYYPHLPKENEMR